jgi:hypothetical protein
MLSDDEVEEVATLSSAYGRQWRETFGRERDDDNTGLHISLKIHLLETHVVPFVRRWRTAGLFGEDAVESIHALINAIHRRYACMRGLIARDKAKHSALAVAQNAGVNEAKRQRTEARKRKRANSA